MNPYIFPLPEGFVLMIFYAIGALTYKVSLSKKLKKLKKLNKKKE